MSKSGSQVIRHTKTILWRYMRSVLLLSKRASIPVKTAHLRIFQHTRMRAATDPRGARRQWRRWYKANKLHQARHRAARRDGAHIGHIPHSLKLEWVA